MKVDDFSTEEILAIFNKALNAETLEEKEAKKAARRRKAKADFCNLNKKTIREVVFFEMDL